jgi:hypothetical protein
VPLFVSRRRLAHRKELPRALGRWALDSGGFTELSTYGRWKTSPEQYAEEVRRFSLEIGVPDFAAIQDWMCEDVMLQKTGLKVKDHQRLTTASYLRLLQLAPEVPWLPVIQGRAIPEYLDHVDRYRAEGIDLTALPRVGVGSVCRRQGTTWAKWLMTRLWMNGLANTHLFGVKKGGLIDECWYPWWGGRIASSDSLAWSAEARRSDPLPGCVHPKCNNCLDYALRWRERLLADIDDWEKSHDRRRVR